MSPLFARAADASVFSRKPSRAWTINFYFSEKAQSNGSTARVGWVGRCPLFLFSLFHSSLSKIYINSFNFSVLGRCYIIFPLAVLVNNNI